MSRFEKRREAISIEGTRASLHSGQLILSCGNPSLDHIVGGGFPIGSIIAIEEDTYGKYWRILTKYFLAEGLVNRNSTFLASLEEDPRHLMTKLPTLVEDQVSRKPNTMQTPEEMRIAFRYNKLSVVDLEEKSTTPIGTSFDLSTRIVADELKIHDISYWDGTQTCSNPNNAFTNPNFQTLLDAIHLKSTSPQFDPSKAVAGEKNLLRICLNSIGSPLWYDLNFPADLIKFVTTLKSIVRNTLSCCFITLPTHLFRHLYDNDLYDSLINQLDYCIALESFTELEKATATNPVFREYHGLLGLVKVSALNTLAPFVPKTRDLGFKLRRKKFVIEKLHLPPELGEDKDERGRQQVQTLSCSGGSGSSRLDF